MTVRCPTCRTIVVWETAAYRPFCSERCKAVDLGRWLREDYRIPAEEGAADSESSEEIPDS
jgi:endogenous inhibitor of DNA gyrase (YacG/DUF329 family)